MENLSFLIFKMTPSSKKEVQDSFLVVQVSKVVGNYRRLKCCSRKQTSAPSNLSAVSEFQVNGDLQEHQAPASQAKE